jgi:hypothetical protein
MALHSAWIHIGDVGDAGKEREDCQVSFNKLAPEKGKRGGRGTWEGAYCHRWKRHRTSCHARLWVVKLSRVTQRSQTGGGSSLRADIYRPDQRIQSKFAY